MRDLNERNLTEEVLARLRDAKDARVRQVSEALVRHLHAFVREVEPTQAEWAAGIDFLTEVGKMCDDKRQEFILLSDTLGVSMLVDAINHRLTAGATETTVFGPFFVEGRRTFALGDSIASDRTGAPMIVTGSVSATDGTPLGGAQIDVWHADSRGFYDVQRSDELDLRGRFEADKDGRFWFWTVRPSPYSIPSDGPIGKMLSAQGRHAYRPEHVHFMMAAPGFETLVTHVFAEGDAYLDSDVVFGVKSSLIKTYEPCGPGTAPDGKRVETPYYHLDYDFVLDRSGP